MAAAAGRSYRILRVPMPVRPYPTPHLFSRVRIGIALQPRGTLEGGAPAPHGAHAFLGYHETAWTINRFAHIARKHGLVDVCLASLTKIYTLPNIEIQDAFFKLREQAKWYTTGHFEA